MSSLALRSSLLLLALACGCGGPAEPAPGEQGAPEQARLIPRKSPDGRAVHARAETLACARELLAELPRRGLKIAPYRITRRGREDHLGEWLAASLTTDMVREGDGRCEVYTRRKLSRVLEERGFQATGLVDRETVRDAAKFSGVDAILVGALDEDSAAGELRLTCEVVDVDTAETIAAARVVVSLGPTSLVEPALEREPAIGALSERLLPGLPHGLVIAVYDVSRGNEEWSTGADLGKGVYERFQGSGKLRCMNRADVSQVLEEKGLVDVGLVQESDQAKAAGFVGAQAILTGSGAVFDQHSEAEVFVVEVETARILAASHVVIRRREAFSRR